MFTFEIAGKNSEGKLWLYEICDGKSKKKELITERLDGARCGGRIIEKENTYILVYVLSD